MIGTETSLMSIVSFVTSMDIKMFFCNGFSRNIIAHNSHDKSSFDNGIRHDRTFQNSVNNSYNRFYVLRFEGECRRCNNFGHVSRNCPMNFKKYVEPNYTNLKTRCCKNKSDHLESENCTLSLQDDHKVKWCVDSGCSKHMTSRKHNFFTLDEGK
jgi:hypothetical protein